MELSLCPWSSELSHFIMGHSLRFSTPHTCSLLVPVTQGQLSTKSPLALAQLGELTFSQESVTNHQEETKRERA